MIVSNKERADINRREFIWVLTQLYSTTTKIRAREGKAFLATQALAALSHPEVICYPDSSAHAWVIMY